MFEWMIRSTPEARTKGEKRGLKVLSTLNEYQVRLFVADKALDWGRGGISRLSQLTGMSRTVGPRREGRDGRAEDARS